MILAVDPGAKGALAWLWEAGGLYRIHDMPMIDKQVSSPLLSEMLRETAVTVAVVEQVSAMPGQGVSTMFKMGRNYGTLLGALGALNIRTEHVTAAKWKRDMGLSKDKDLSRRRAAERWPAHAELFKRKMDDGRAEAALLGAWWLTMGREA